MPPSRRGLRGVGTGSQRLRWAAWALALIGAWLLGAFTGPQGLEAPGASWTAPPWNDAQWRAIVWEVRLPRGVGSALVGALLGLAGALAQGLFRNPLADPHLLGSASGASLAMVLAVATGLVSGQASDAARWSLTAWAFFGALGGVVLTLVLARGAVHTLRLLLAGVVVGVVLGALTQWLMLWSADAWRTLQAFSLGNTALLGWPACAALAMALALASGVGWFCAAALDALALGDDAARSLGLPLPALRLVLVAVLAWATAAAVAQTGLVAFVGLAAPHLVRGLCGGRHRLLLPAATLAGALLMTVADVLCRWAMPPQELPVGLLTSVLGGCYLLWRLHRETA